MLISLKLDKNYSILIENNRKSFDFKVIEKSLKGRSLGLLSLRKQLDKILLEKQ